MHNELYAHFVWATWDRLPLLVPGVREQVYAQIKAKCVAMRCFVHALGGVEDHIHLVVQMASTVSASLLMKEVKGASSHLITHQTMPDTFFKWQGGYAVFAVTSEGLPHVIRYVQHQEEPHKAGTIHRGMELPPNPSHP